MSGLKIVPTLRQSAHQDHIIHTNHYNHVIHTNMIGMDEDYGDGKHVFGTVKVGERGQIVIPKKAREIFGINPGDTLMVLGDEKRGIAIVKADKFRSLAMKMLKLFENDPEDPEV